MLKFQLSWFAHGFDLAVHHDGNAVAILCFIHIMGRDKNCRSAVRRLIDHGPEFPPCDRIDATGRLGERFAPALSVDEYKVVEREEGWVVTP